MLKNVFFAVLLAAPFMSGCGLFSGEEDPFDIVFREEVPFTFTIDAANFCPVGVDCTAAEGPSPDKVVLPDFETDIDIDVLAATGSTQLREVSSRLKSVEIEKVDYVYSNNNLNIQTPKISLYVGQLAASSRGSSVLVVDVPVANAGENKTGTAAVDEANRDASSDILKSLQISMIPYMQPAAIERGQPSPPKGKVDVEMTMTLKFVANPTDL
ncbi:MAG: hypothetical protein R3E66_12010 [bacterium]